MLESEGVAVASVATLHRAEMQFEGQSHLLGVELPDGAPDRDALQAAFVAAYWQRFEVALPEIRAVLVNLHTAVIGKRAPVALDVFAGTPADTQAAAQTGERWVWFAAGWRTTPIYRRERLPRGIELHGPAILEQLDATTVIEPGDRATVDALGNVIIAVANEGGAL